MGALGWYLALVAGVPLAIGLCRGAVKLLRRRRQRRWVAWQRRPDSVAAIATRIARERQEHAVRWPLADPDHGAVADERPTRTLPLIPGEPVRAVPEPTADEAPTLPHQRTAARPPRHRRYVLHDHNPSDSE